ncbi:hypothetical protein XM38_007830 [Halomicronema hongdechloris C2206]|uniref:Uncharacterized protein n=1 Tax=Halomicronema hongdechloris C2206 TaxID=1641165 RepID=A0A1Z3HHV7_9CYAN|nr:hypothetical protein [Halomicronema hongdechloris]ASC69853.1 hypothetical protein XM38_007830 [Halomicronema hongdechloris C2206]
MTPSAAPQTLSNRQVIWVLAGSVGLALAVGSLVRLMTASPEQADVSTPKVVTETSPAPPLFTSPLASTTSLLTLADPGLLQPSDKAARLAQVTAGRTDPFAPLTRPSLTGPDAATATPVATAATTTPVAVATPPQSLPTVSVTAPPASLPPLPSREVAPETPAVAAASSPARNPVDALELSGVVQVGDRIHLIVKEPNAKTSRYVSVGDSLAGGRVRVHRIEMSEEPVVILAYNGQHYTRTIGSMVVAGML